MHRLRDASDLSNLVICVNDNSPLQLQHSALINITYPEVASIIYKYYYGSQIVAYRNRRFLALPIGTIS